MWPASRHYNQQRPRACLACPHVTQAAGPCCRPLRWSQSVSLRRLPGCICCLSLREPLGSCSSSYLASWLKAHTLFSLLCRPCCRRAGECGGLPQPGWQAGASPQPSGPQRRPAAAESCGRERLLPSRPAGGAGKCPCPSER